MNAQQRESLLKLASRLMLDEAISACGRYLPFHSTHEGFAVLKEEVDESWDAIKANDRDKTIQEMIQVGAMAIRFVAELQQKKDS